MQAVYSGRAHGCLDPYRTFLRACCKMRLEVLGISPATGLKAASLIKKETAERRTSNIERPTSNNVFCQFKKRLCKAKPPSKFRDSFVSKSIKRSAINIRRSMLDVRCSTFNLFAVPARRSSIQEVQGLTSNLKRRFVPRSLPRHGGRETR